MTEQKPLEFSSLNGYPVLGSEKPDEVSALFSEIKPETRAIGGSAEVSGLNQNFHVQVVSEVISEDPSLNQVYMVKVSYHSGPVDILVPKDKVSFR